MNELNAELKKLNEYRLSRGKTMAFIGVYWKVDQYWDEEGYHEDEYHRYYLIAPGDFEIFCGLTESEASKKVADVLATSKQVELWFAEYRAHMRAIGRID